MLNLASRADVFRSLAARVGLWIAVAVALLISGPAAATASPRSWLLGSPLATPLASPLSAPHAGSTPYPQTAELTDPKASSSTLAVSGNTAVMGGSGAAYVFTYANGNWTETAKLTPSDGTASDNFGEEVAIQNGTIVVSSPQHTPPGGKAGQGALYVFTGAGSTWTQKAELSVSNGVAGSGFGGVSSEFDLNPLAIDGTTIVAAAPHYMVGDVEQGQVYVFSDASGTWTQAATLNDPKPQPTSGGSDEPAATDFGQSVGVSGNTIVVGAPEEEDGSIEYEGAAYVFTLSNGSWNETSELRSATVSGVQAGCGGESFGAGVAISGTTIAVGSPDDLNSSEAAVSGSCAQTANYGAVYVFNGTSQVARLPFAGNNYPSYEDGYFGDVVELSGSTLVVGDPVGTATGPLNANGVAWVYSNSGGAWALSTNLTPASDGEGDFGESVGVSNGTIVVGGDAKSEPYAAWVFGSPEPSISGFVYNQACTGDDLSGSCGQPTGVAGVMVLVKGNDSKGNLVSQTATTAADGSWSVPVSNGTYEAGPSADGQTFIGPAFSPASIPGIAVNGQSVPNTNFTACLNLGDAAGSATDRSGGTIATESSDHARGDLAPRAASQFLASQCKTTYTITLDATIPHEIVDPSPYAPYNPAKDGQELPPSKYPGESNAFGNKVYGKVLDSLLEQYPKYPACFSADTLELLRKKNVGMGWYTTMSEGSLGSVSIPLLWNQHDQYVYYPNPNQPFTSSFGELTRTWHYWIEDKDKTTVHVPGGPTVKYKKKSFYTCHVTAPVEPMAFVLPGGSDKTGRVDPNAFTIEIVWLIPFNPIGEVIPPNTTAAKVLRYTFGEKLGDGIVESFESLPWPLRFGFTYGVLEGVAEAPELLAEIGKETEAAVKTTAEGAKEIEEGASPLHILHNIHSLYDLGRGIPECYEHCLDALAGYASLMFGKASYPAMVTIIRGKFISNYSSVTDTASGTTTPQRIDSTTLAMSQDATDFPDISVTVDRDAKPNGGNPSSSYCPTQNGQLPWTSPKCIIVGNGGFALGGKISEVLSPFDDGEESVDQIAHLTNSLQPFVANFKKTLNLESSLGYAQTLAHAPQCGDSGAAQGENTVCWTFKDGMP